MNKRHLLSVAVASLLAGTASQVSAATLKLVNLKTPTPIQVANENPATLTNSELKGGAVDSFVLQIPVPDYTVNTSNPFFVKLKLSNAVTFKGTWTMKCKTAGANYGNGNLQVGAGTDTVTFQLPVAAGASAKLVSTMSGCIVQGSAFGMPSGLKDARFSASVEYKDGSTNKADKYTGSLITLVNSLATTVNRSGAVVIVDVAAGSKEFTEANDAGGATKYTKKTAYLGKVTYTTGTNASLDALHMNAGRDVTAYDVISTLTITLNGAPLGAVTNSGGVYISNANTCANVTIPRKKASGTTVTFSLGTTTASLAAVSAMVKNGMYFCLDNANSNVIDKGTITVTLTGTGKNSFRPSFGSAGNLVEVTKNGASTKVLNIPSPTNTTDTAFIRINNMVNQSGKVLGTLYGQDGAVLGTANSVLATLNAMQATALDSAALATAVGVDPATGWTGRAWLQIDSELSSISVQGLVRNNASSTLLNLSDGVSLQK